MLAERLQPGAVLRAGSSPKLAIDARDSSASLERLRKRSLSLAEMLPTSRSFPNHASDQSSVLAARDDRLPKRVFWMTASPLT